MQTSRRIFLKTMSSMLTTILVPGVRVRYASATPKTVRIGVVAALTGPLASIGNNSLNGFKMAAEEINSQGGVLGNPIKLTVYDLGDAKNAKKAMYALNHYHNPIAIIGSESVSFDKYLSQIAEKIKIPFFILNPFRRTWFKEGLTYTFRISPSVGLLADQTLNYLLEISKSKKIPISKIGTFRFASPSWAEAQKKISGTASHRGLNLVHDLEVPYKLSPGAANDLVYASKKGAPDLVYLLISGPLHMKLLVEAMRRQNIGAKAIVGFFSLLSNAAYVKQEGRLFLNLMDANYWGNPKLTKTQRFEKSYLKLFGYYPSNSAFAAYTATYVVTNAVHSAGSLDRRRFVSVLRKGKFSSYLLAQSEPIQFDESGSNVNATSVLLQVSNPRPITIYPRIYSVKEPVFPLGSA